LLHWYFSFLVSHLDQVHKYAQIKTIFQNGDYLLAFNGPNQVGTGGDDLVGVFMCLQLLEDYNFIKVVFFVAEEVGCIGSSACDLSFFDDCMFIGQADRKNNSDFINYSNGVQLFDQEFSTFVAPVLKDYNYKECTGIATDAGCLSKRNVGIACFNISKIYITYINKDYECTSFFPDLAQYTSKYNLLFYNKKVHGYAKASTDTTINDDPTIYTPYTIYDIEYVFV